MIIKCRSRKSKACYHGKPVENSIYREEGDTPADADRKYRADGTYHIEDKTILCDPCLLAQEKESSQSPFARLIPDDLV